MALIVTKPISFNTTQLKGAVATYEASLSSAADINGYVNTDNSTLGHNIGWETSPTDSEWADGSSVGYSLFTMVISAIGSDTNPSISTLNNHVFITDYMHSSHSNSWNDTTISNTGAFDLSNMTVTISGAETISFTSYATTHYSGSAPNASIRSVDTSASTWYLNVIQAGSQSSGGSSNEDYPTDYWSKTDFQTDSVNFKDQVISKISTNQNDIIEFLVKNSLTPEALKRLHVQLSNDGIIT